MSTPYRDGAPRKPELGIIAVWTGEGCISRAFRIPHEGLVLGRDLVAPTKDDRIGRNHARVEQRDGHLHITDLGSTNGTYVGGQPIGERTAALVPLSVILTGRTVWIVTDDVDHAQVDKLARTIFDAIREAAPDLPVHASAIEDCMLLLQRSENLDAVLSIARIAAAARAHAGGELRGDDIAPLEPHQNAVQAPLVGRRRGPQR